MEREFCSYEQSLVLKELGFNEKCLMKYQLVPAKHCNDSKIYGDKKFIVLSPFDCKTNYECFNTPLKSQALKWFMQKSYLYYSIRYKDDEHINKFEASIWEKGHYCNVWNEIYSTYEEAENACIDKLIELAKQQAIS